ncbi:MAG: oligosaccharide flippase family protein [archaeon]|nr:oligosaccharide flippase family protein [archaeon]
MSGTRYLNTLMGDPRKAILSMVLPFLIAASVVQVNQFVDTFWVSGLGNVAGSAVATIVPVYGLLICAGLGIGVGATTTIAYRLGQRDRERASRLAGQAVLLGIICASAGSVISFILLDPAIDLMGAQSIRAECREYIMPFLLLSPILLTEMILGGTLRGEGAARKSTVMQVSAAVFNMVIDPILIYGLGMGLAGAGLATCVSALLSLMIGATWYLTGGTVLRPAARDFRPHRETMLEVLNIGGPRTGQSLISNMTDLLQRIFIIAAGGTNAVMFYNYTWRYIGLAELPAGAYDTAMVPVCASARGQGDPQRMRAGFRYATRCVIILSTLLAVLLFVFADPLVSILTYEDSMRALAGSFVWTLRASAFLLPFAALMGIGTSMLQALDRSRMSMWYILGWGFLKLARYAVACTVSFEAIIWCMVAVHVIGGISLTWLAHREFSRQFPGMGLLTGSSR